MWRNIFQTKFHQNLCKYSKLSQIKSAKIHLCKFHVYFDGLFGLDLSEELQGQIDFTSSIWKTPSSVNNIHYLFEANTAIDIKMKALFFQQNITITPLIISILCILIFDVPYPSSTAFNYAWILHPFFSNSLLSISIL